MTFTIPAIAFDWQVFWHCIAGLFAAFSLFMFIGCLHYMTERDERDRKLGSKLFWYSLLCDPIWIVSLSIAQGF